MDRFHAYAVNRSFIERIDSNFSHIWLPFAVESKMKIPLILLVLWAELSEKQGESEKRKTKGGHKPQ